METILTLMGWGSIAILAWFIFGFLRNLIKAWRRPRSRTDTVSKDMYSADKKKGGGTGNQSARPQMRTGRRLLSGRRRTDRR